MAASLSLRIQSGASPGTQSAAVTGIDFESADNATNTLANRQANPITVPSSGSAYSYEKWLKLYVDTAPANSVSNFKAWSAQGGSGGAGTGLTINGAGAQSTYATPVSSASTVATSPIPTTQGAAVAWDAGSYTAVGNTTEYLVLQLQVDSTASQGNMGQVTISYSYDET